MILTKKYEKKKNVNGMFYEGWEIYFYGIFTNFLQIP